jgi:putative transposase
MLAYVLMGNHFHLLIQLTRETLSKGMHWLNGSYGQAFNRRHRCVGHLFQGRPHAPLVDGETYLLEVLRYVVLNPVRAGFVKRPQDYVWSSYRAAVGLATPQKWLAVDDVLVNFGTDPRLARAAYQEFVEDAVGLHTNPWKNLVGQIYLGSEAWLDEIGVRIKLKPRSDDHPRAQRLAG